MPLTREITTINDFIFQKPIRAIFSGSSQSGKTFLIGKMLENQFHLFGDEFQIVKYYYPTYLDESPVNYHKSMVTPICYERGFPSKESVLSMPRNSLIIIDDQFDDVLRSNLMNQVFKVISGKKDLSIIVVTQNYFQQGQFSRDIRNSCNYVGLFRNCGDSSLNRRVAQCFGLKRAYEAAEKDSYENTVYPYFFIDQTQRAQLSSFRLYTDILGKIRTCYDSNGMKGYIVDEKLFLRKFKVLQKNSRSVIAVERKENAHKKRPISKSTKRRKRKFEESCSEQSSTTSESSSESNSEFDSDL